MAGMSSKALGSLENKKKYNGIEFENDLDLNTYDTFYWELNPQTGRWWQIDPKIESMEAWSPYVSNYDNPVRYSDFLGDEPTDDGPGDGVVSALVDIGRKATMFVGGALNAWSSNQLLGVGRKDVNEMPGMSYRDKIVAKAGQVVGDAASIVTGALEISAAATGEVASVGVATPVAVPVALHGASSIALGSTNLIKGFLDPVKREETSTSKSNTRSSSGSEKQSKVEKSKTTERIGDGKFTKTTEVRPGKGPGQSRAEYVRYKNKDGKVIRTQKNTYDRSNKFQHKKPLRDGPEGRPQD